MYMFTTIVAYKALKYGIRKESFMDVNTSLLLDCLILIGLAL